MTHHKLIHVQCTVYIHSICARYAQYANQIISARPSHHYYTATSNTQPIFLHDRRRGKKNPDPHNGRIRAMNHDINVENVRSEEAMDNISTVWGPTMPCQSNRSLQDSIDHKKPHWKPRRRHHSSSLFLHMLTTRSAVRRRNHSLPIPTVGKHLSIRANSPHSPPNWTANLDRPRNQDP